MQFQKLDRCLLILQGRILFDVICYHMASQDAKEHTYLLECDAEVQGKLAKHLKMFRIRKKVGIIDLIFSLTRLNSHGFECLQ